MTISPNTVYTSQTTTPNTKYNSSITMMSPNSYPQEGVVYTLNSSPEKRARNDGTNASPMDTTE